MSALAAFLQGTVQAVGLLAVLLAVPLTFDVGGEACGVSFTFVLSVFYFVLCTLRLLFRGTRLGSLGDVLYFLQFLIIPSLLLVHLSICPTPAHSLLSTVVAPWKMALDHATGVFTILEGFCTLIVVQAIGRVTSQAARRSDAALLIQLVVASLMITADLYLLFRIYLFPEVLGLATATLIGAALTISLSIGVYGIWSRRGNVVESTLVFSYIVYQIYLTFTDFQSSGSPKLQRHSLWPLFPSFGTSSGAWPEEHLLKELQLPPILLESYTEFMKTVAELTPAGIKTMIDFVLAASASITPSILVSLIVRLVSYLGAMRIVPFIRRQTPHRQPWQPQPRRSRVLLLAYSYSPILIIAVYSHLLLQHFGHIVHVPKYQPLEPFELAKVWTNSRQAWQFWGWANVFTTLFLYGSELMMSPAGEAIGTPPQEMSDVLEM